MDLKPDFYTVETIAVQVAKSPSYVKGRISLADLIPAAQTAFYEGMAAKLARLVYRILRYGMKYVDQGAKFYEAQHRNLQVKQLKWKAAKLGYQIIQAPAI